MRSLWQGVGKYAWTASYTYVLVAVQKDVLLVRLIKCAVWPADTPCVNLRSNVLLRRTCSVHISSQSAPHIHDIWLHDLMDVKWIYVYKNMLIINKTLSNMANICSHKPGILRATCFMQSRTNGSVDFSHQNRTKNYKLVVWIPNADFIFTSKCSLWEVQSSSLKNWIISFVVCVKGDKKMDFDSLSGTATMLHHQLLDHRLQHVIFYKKCSHKRK